MPYQEDDPRIDAAMKFLRLASDADSNNRMEALEDLKFAAGDQWPVEIQNSRNLEARPCLTINKVDSYVRQVTNQQRQQRPRIKVHPVNNEADLKIAKTLEGITRHIEVNSNADTAYDNAFDYAVRMGWGYWRVETDYVREDSFDQEIYIRPIHNPFTVYFDPNSVEPDGSDAEQCLVTEVIPKATFREMYPDADDGSGFTLRATGDSSAEWVMKEDIRIAEYFHTERKATTLVLLSDGTKLYKEDLPDADMMLAAGVTIISERKTYKKVIKWCKVTSMQVLEEGEWIGSYIPVIPVYGAQLTVEDKRKKFGLVRHAKDPQRMYNFWRTSQTESIALAPKAKWLLAEGQDEGHENEWAQANIKSAPVLRYKQTDIEGRVAPQPTRLQPEAPPQGIMEAASSINNDLQAVLGIFDPNQMPSGNISGKALNGQQQQIDLSNYHFYDNLTRSIKHTGKIILDLIPKIYDSERVMRIIGDDGQPDMVTINQRDAVGSILNDVTVGEYDIVMDTGPGYQSKRIQAVEAMMPLMAKDELFKIAGDLVFRNMDFPGADIIADRLAASNPLAQIDDKSPIPPQVQMQLAQSKQVIEQQQQQMQAMQLEINNRGQVAQIREDGATKRKLMEVTSKAHNTETMAEVKVNDQNTRAITSQNKTEIDAIVQLLLHHMDTSRLLQEIERRNMEQNAYATIAAQDISHQGSPFLQQ
ncbi:Phage P22-like portal protein [uncultured Caudovirales phage]|uniref:Phage P22-like portal protein n=1 Tax=uncultured Caudovirales phage TaxID=2100421 RepID=A0A6J5PSD1_9CAUD|nr:Phage P22-like portal protein [uncultured Caudovirales phage]